jgi:hypothetical protein
VTSNFTREYTYGVDGLSEIPVHNLGALQADGTVPLGDTNTNGTLTYVYTYSDIGPPRGSCPAGSSITQGASGTAYSHGALQAVPAGDGSYSLSIGGDAQFTHQEHIGDCGNNSDRPFLLGAYLRAYVPLSACPGHPAPSGTRQLGRRQPQRDRLVRGTPTHRR